MTPEAQITAICSVMPKGFLFGFKWCFQGQWKIFDPLNDLNAMHAALKSLPKSMRNRYVNELQDIIQRDNDDTLVQPDLDFYWCNAPANQMSEAFLRTLNLWTDEQ